MKKMMIAVAMTIALPAAAYAKAAPAPSAKPADSGKMPMADCKAMHASMGGAAGHTGHAMPSGSTGHAGHAMMSDAQMKGCHDQMQSGAKMPQAAGKAPADAHQNHQQ